MIGLFIFGLLFTICSPLWLLGAVMFLSESLLGAIMFFLCFVVFFIIGVSSLKMYYAKKKEMAEIIASGRIMEGEVLGYRDCDGVLVNDVPPFSLIIKAENKGYWEQFEVETGQYDRSRYPIGSTVYFAMSDKGLAILSDKDLPEEL